MPVGQPRKALRKLSEKLEVMYSAANSISCFATRPKLAQLQLQLECKLGGIGMNLAPQRHQHPSQPAHTSAAIAISIFQGCCNNGSGE